MIIPLFRSIITITLLLAWSCPSFAETLDDYYLKQFGESTSSAKTSRLIIPSEIVEPPHCGMPLKKMLRKDWDKLQSSTQKVLAKQLAAPALAGETTFASTHFKFHYATSGSDAPPFGWVEVVATTFEEVYTYYQNHGYRMPSLSGGYYDIYLRDLAPVSLYGQTTSTTAAPVSGYPNAYSSYMEIDNNFTDSKYVNASGGPYSALDSLRITAAHEFHHAIQYGYNYYFDIWYAEATSTWFEDEVYDAVNQLYNYVPSWFRNSTNSLDIAVNNNALSTGAGYSRWIFNRYLAERFGTDVIRNAWQNLASLSSPGGDADIPMAPVLNSLLSNRYGSSLGAEISGFGKQSYQRNWTTHTNEISRIHTIVPTASYGNYPVNSSSSQAASITLPHYSFASYNFTPSASSPANLSITLTKTGGIASSVFLDRNGLITEVQPNAGGTSYTIAGFSQMSAATDKVVLQLANATGDDGHNANFSTDGSIVPTTSLPIPSVSSTTASSGSSSGGGGGCFIATAAYGSYLHPQVQTLRDFRDQYLLTNAPGQFFVAQYYRFSPALADFIAQHEYLRAMVRLLLTPLVAVVAYPLLTLAACLLFGGALLNRKRIHRLIPSTKSPNRKVV